MVFQTISKIISISLVTVFLVFQSTAICAEDENNTQDSSEFQSFVPSLFGLSVSEVQALLPQYDLTLGSVLEEESDSSAGTVLSQDQKPDTNVTRFTAVNISVAIPRVSTNSVAKTTPTDDETAATEMPLPALTETAENASATITEEIVPAQPEPQVAEEVVAIQPEPQAEEETVVAAPEEPQTIVEIEPTPIKETVEESAAAAETIVEEKMPEPESVVEPQVEVETTVAKDVSSDTDGTEEADNTSEKNKSAPSLLNGRKLTFTVEPEGHIQVTRKITMEMKLSPPVDSDNLQYQFNISGKPYNSSSPTFTHVFDEEETVILTASTRLPGKAWLHSGSRRVKVGKYVPRKIKVPNIVGMSASKATALLKSKGLVVGNTRDKIVKGRSGILEQMPKAGTIRTEDDNKIHYVKAVDEKFQVQVIANAESLVTGGAVDIFVKVSPKPRSSKTRYSFIVEGETHHSSSPKWQYIFKEEGNVKVIAKAIINGEGTFESAPITLAISNAWKMPTAVISPYTLSAEAGETVKFESASAYDTSGKLEFAWSDGEGNTSTAPEFLINTGSMPEGEHSVTLKIKDERGYENTATAQLIITAKVVAEESKEQIGEIPAEVPTEQPLDVEAEINTQADDLATVVDTIVETEKEIIPEVKEAASEIVADDVKIADSQVVTENEPVVNTISNSQGGVNWGIWIWLLMIAIVLLPILWIIKKLRGKPEAKKQAVVTAASPYGDAKSKKKQKAKVVSSSGNRFAHSDDKSKSAPVPKPANKKSANPDLVDFDLDVKPSGQKSKKDELTDFNLDD